MQVSAQILVALVCCVVLVSAAPSDLARHELEEIVSNVTSATFYRYNLQDDNGNQMAVVKVIQSWKGDYLAVSHCNPPSLGGVFAVNLQTSTDLKTFHFVRQLGQHASQPYIFEASNRGYVVAWEQDPHNHILLEYFNSYDDLINGKVAERFEAPQTLSKCAEGTPNIYSVTFNSNPPSILNSVISIGGHYYDRCVYDRQMQATLVNFKQWKAWPNEDMNNAVLYWGVKGNIGGRDSAIYKNYTFGLIEGMFVNQDFCSWRMFMYDYQTHNSDKLQIVTHKKSPAFGNPRITSLRTPEGHNAIAVSYFLFCANEGEGGPLFFYRII